ncbi:MAG: 23S rRNA (uracil(1939)-C(5))-methyltransferase RlmD [Gammaproteobacteria bacterium]|nr:23S rRNA (uracil(1939)-C(5))-methyltransferase RlmD [Gammaproteobacteria bacterium]
MQINSIIEALEIEGLTHDGRGVSHVNGKTLFVNGAVPGDIVTAKVRQLHDKFNEADCLTIEQASSERVTPFCPVYEQCGGCQLQHLSIQSQRHWKSHNFITRLTQAVDSKQCETVDSLVSDDQNYRRRARLGLVISKKDKVARLGFRQQGSNELIDIEQCPVLTPALNKAIQTHRDALLETASRAYKEITFVEADNGVFGEAINASKTEPENLPFYTLNTPASINSAHTLPLRFDFHEEGFIQVNAPLNQAMVTQALSWLDLKSDHKVLDLFCGIGNFTLPIAQQVATTVGIEGEQSLVEIATHNADINQLEGVHFSKANLFNDMTPLPWFKNNQYDRILLDPGRQGAFDLCKTLGKLQAQIIVYVSCNSATLIRDIKELEKQGYRLTKAGLIDMFPHTTHTEVMVQLTKTHKAAKKVKKRPNFKI